MGKGDSLRMAKTSSFFSFLYLLPSSSVGPVGRSRQPHAEEAQGANDFLGSSLSGKEGIQRTVRDAMD